MTTDLSQGPQPLPDFNLDALPDLNQWDDGQAAPQYRTHDDANPGYGLEQTQADPYSHVLGHTHFQSPNEEVKKLTPAPEFGGPSRGNLAHTSQANTPLSQGYTPVHLTSSRTRYPSDQRSPHTQTHHAPTYGKPMAYPNLSAPRSSHSNEEGNYGPHTRELTHSYINGRANTTPGRAHMENNAPIPSLPNSSQPVYSNTTGSNPVSELTDFDLDDLIAYDALHISAQALENPYGHPSRVEPQLHTPRMHHVEVPLGTVRPDALYTPLMSPAVTPKERVNQYVDQSSHPYTSFEPLTSPALKAVNPDFSKPQRLALRHTGPPLSIRGPYKAPLMKSPMMLPSQGVPRAARLSPFMEPTPNQARARIVESQGLGVVAPSGFEPGLKRKSAFTNSSKRGRATPGTTPVFGPTVGVSPRASPVIRSSLVTSDGFTIPPPRRKTSTEFEGQSGVKQELPQGPAEGMMNFTMGKLMAQQVADSVKPPVRPRRKSLNPKELEFNTKFKAFGARHKMDPKKQSHKLAEQGRRNRMNVAIQELYTMLPLEFIHRYQQDKTEKGEAIIPSKATTVEVACDYIRWLRGEMSMEDCGDPELRREREDREARADGGDEEAIPEEDDADA